jgi:hypothetical protein
MSDCLLKKLAAMVKAIDNVEKTGYNEFQKYKYVKAADVAWMVRKALSAANVYMVSDVVEARNYTIPAKEGFMQAVDVKMEFSFFDGDAPDTLPIVFHSYGTGTDKGDKAIFKAQTGALKYGLRHAFLVPDDSDPEADISTDQATTAAQAIGHQKVAQLKKANGSDYGQRIPAGSTKEGDDLVETLQASLDAQNAKKNGGINFPPIPAAEPPKPRVERGADVDDVVGVITAVKDKKTKEGRAYKTVTLTDLFDATLELSAFDDFALSDGKLFQYLVKGAVGQEATFTYKTKEKNGVTYHNILNVTRIGSHRWDEYGEGVLEASR